MEKIERITIEIDPAKKSKFKAACSLGNRTMKDEIASFVDIYIKNPRILEELK